MTTSQAPMFPVMQGSTEPSAKPVVQKTVRRAPDSPAAYMFNACRLPRGSRELLRTVTAAAARLASKLAKVDLPAGSISPFARAYFESKQADLQSNLQRDSFLMVWALAPLLKAGIRADHVTLVDYGGGCGDLSLLAREAGVGVVIYNDLFDTFCHDARQIAEAVGLVADHYVPGDVNALLGHVRDSGLSPNCVVSYDVLEHIYDVDDFLGKIVNVTDGPLALTLASGANPRNRMIRNRLMKLQRQMELVGRGGKSDDRDPRDTVEAYLPLRRRLIAKAAPTLSDRDREMLTTRTRGMRSEDVSRAVHRYVATRQLPPMPMHATNTCDPLTGNWCEQLLNPDVLKVKLAAAGMKSRVLAGYYGTGAHGSIFKRMARREANVWIRRCGGFGLRAAPFYCVHATRELGRGAKHA